MRPQVNNHGGATPVDDMNIIPTYTTPRWGWVVLYYRGLVLFVEGHISL